MKTPERCRLAMANQIGVALIEFSLSILVFIVVVMGVIEFGRALFQINMAGKATQLATRLATVCGLDGDQPSIIKKKVRYYIEASGQVNIPTEKEWLTFDRNSDACYSVPTIANPDPCWISTSLSNLTVNLMIPLLDIKIPLPEYRITQVREAMTSDKNPACNQ